jgi:VIT1/CCC1 family predicted Fe2+/Mn2+ transporter
VLAALTSAATFTAGAALPLLLAALLPMALIVVGEVVGSILFLALLGAVGAIAGGARPWKPVARVVFWGALAMALTAGIGRLVGTSL